MSKEVKLTDLQSRFVEEYPIDNNQTKAAVRAGYSERTARTSGYRNMQNDEIVRLIEEKRKEMRERLQQQFASDAIEARKVMYDIMQDELAPEHVRLSAAKDFMDRAGFKPVDKQETTLTANLDVNERSQIFNRYLNDADD